jgi:glycosyltransferase involved in cell wall biosynthesis
MGRTTRAGARPANVCYILPENYSDSTQHYAHVPRLLESLTRRVRVAAIVERGETLRIAGVEPVIVLRHGARLGVRRSLEYIFAARRMREAGFDTFFLRYSRLAAITLIASRPFMRHRLIYWSSGQADMLARSERLSMSRRCDMWLNKWVLQHVDRVATGPEHMLAYMSQRWDVPRSRITLLYNDIDVDRFSPPGDPEERRALRERFGFGDQDWVVLMVHRLAYRRGSRILVPIVEKLVRNESMDHVRLVIIGDGPDVAILEHAAAASREASEHLVLKGAIPNAELPDWYRAADTFLMPSYEEGFPRVLLEAMASSLPIVTTTAGGSRDVVGDDYPFVADTGDVDALVGALARLHSMPSPERDALGARLRARVIERYSTDRVADMIARLLAC